MSDKNSKKNAQLGMPIGTASNRLRKSILWSCVKQLGQDTCFQCGEKITNVDELSIEHKVPWLDSEDPKDLFFDLNNIAFSHLVCNTSASRKTYAKCGTRTKYDKGCRCELCTRENTLHKRKMRSSRRIRTGYDR